ncbi:nickel pincer cofactor biosynthesis protein LarC [Microaceticoccus formicicus]|uniref:nickel pincer cofactor biosynthesis protein LarC n=1 Tax=Microaceticoccus formicicus TaxID=3118105 RepID=UPI003CCFF941|nr:nickel pincer cofactor biosynthesis protein LarC [Peptoniphilaceae bacterium AMB_02]
MILYFDCFSGISGNMTIAALLELGIVDFEYLKNELKKLKLDEFEISLEKTDKLGISASYFDVTSGGVSVEDIHHHNHEHDHNHGHHHDHNHHGHHEHHEHKHEHDHNHDHYHEHDHEHGHHHHEHDHEHGHTHHHHDHVHDHHHHDHVHRNLFDIEKIIDDSELNEGVKALSKKMFNFVAAAESTIHNKSFEELHFHEVGAIDSIVDIVGTAILIDAIAPEKIYSSKVHVGNGFVKCAHGMMPLPAPATLEIIKDAGIPVFSKGIKAELTTPTGAAILAAIVDEYMDIPEGMTVERIGYGAGKRNLEIPNILRISAGDVKKNSSSILKLEFEVDDMTGEELGYFMDKVLEEGALDICYTPVQMKKNRPGISVRILCNNENLDEFSKIIFSHSTTIGFRYGEVNRMKMERRIEEKDTEFGKIRQKISGFGDMEKSKHEYEDIVKILENADKQSRLEN